MPAYTQAPVPLMPAHTQAPQRPASQAQVTGREAPEGRTLPVARDNPGVEAEARGAKQGG